VPLTADTKNWGGCHSPLILKTGEGATHR